MKMLFIIKLNKYLRNHYQEIIVVMIFILKTLVENIEHLKNHILSKIKLIVIINCLILKLQPNYKAQF